MVYDTPMRDALTGLLALTSITWDERLRSVELPKYPHIKLGTLKRHYPWPATRSIEILKETGTVSKVAPYKKTGKIVYFNRAELINWYKGKDEYDLILSPDPREQAMAYLNICFNTTYYGYGNMRHSLKHINQLAKHYHMEYEELLSKMIKVRRNVLNIDYFDIPSELGFA